MKVCYRCKVNQPKSEFHKDKQKTDGLYSSCKSCMSLVYTGKNWREVRKHPRYAKIKRKHKVKKYGLTMESYQKMIDLQGNRCAICDLHQDELTKLLSIDHDHKTGKVRGLLCGNCNRGIGHLQDSVKILEKAIEYVTKNT